MTTDEVSVEQAYVRYRTEIYRFLLRRTRDHHEAEDLTQEAFADAAATLSRSTAPTSMRGWLFAVAERRAVDEHRRRKRAARVTDMLLGLPDAAGDDEAADVEAALRKLPQAQRQIIEAQCGTWARDQARAHTASRPCASAQTGPSATAPAITAARQLMAPPACSGIVAPD